MSAKYEIKVKVSTVHLDSLRMIHECKLIADLYSSYPCI
jgi:hypothetical protein